MLSMPMARRHMVPPGGASAKLMLLMVLLPGLTLAQPRQPRKIASKLSNKANLSSIL